MARMAGKRVAPELIDDDDPLNDYTLPPEIRASAESAGEDVEKIEAFLKVRAGGGNVKDACKLAHVSYSRPPRWRRTVDGFDAEDTALRRERAIRIEDILFEIAEGTREANRDQAYCAKQLLTAHWRELYGDKREITGADGGAIQVETTAADAEALKRLLGGAAIADDRGKPS